MKRLLAVARWDVQLQYRNGFYYASAFVAGAVIVLLWQFPKVDYGPFWPAIILENLLVNSFYFMSALVLLEKGEGTLEMQIVTPLRRSEYLVSKTLTLSLLSVIETLVIVVAISGVHFRWLPLLVGVLYLVGVLALYGFFVVARYDSISDFLLPSVLWTVGYSLPLLYYFNVWRSPLMFLHPVQAPLVLIQAAFDPGLPGWQVVYGLVYGAVWLGISYYAAQRAFYRFVIRKEGVRA